MIHHFKKLATQLNTERSEMPELISYQSARRAIGWLGILLPFLLISGAYVFDDAQRLQPSISHYYYTNMREVFVGLLWAVALFLFTYKGHSKMDSLATNLAGILAVTISLFPTNYMEGFPGQHAVISMVYIEWHGTIHDISAGLFFLILALISLFLFTKSNKSKHLMGHHKRRRNTVFKVCGIVMLASILLIAINKPVLKINAESTITYWTEVILLVAFGTSWLIKGELLLSDPNSN